MKCFKWIIFLFCTISLQSQTPPMKWGNVEQEHLQMKEYAAGKVAAEKCLDYLDEGSFNWFKYQELYFMLSMHTANYQGAYEVFKVTTGHKSFQFLPPSFKG